MPVAGLSEYSLKSMEIEFHVFFLYIYINIGPFCFFMPMNTFPIFLQVKCCVYVVYEI